MSIMLVFIQLPQEYGFEKQAFANCSKSPRYLLKKKNP